MDNEVGLSIDEALSQADGHAERINNTTLPAFDDPDEDEDEDAADDVPAGIVTDLDDEA